MYPFRTYKLFQILSFFLNKLFLLVSLALTGRPFYQQTLTPPQWYWFNHYSTYTILTLLYTLLTPVVCVVRLP